MFNSLLQDSEDTYLLDLNNLQAKLQQLQKQVDTIEVENSHLATEKKYFIKTIEIHVGDIYVNYTNHT